jgi:hypothetical protein
VQKLSSSSPSKKPKRTINSRTNEIVEFIFNWIDHGCRSSALGLMGNRGANAIHHAAKITPSSVEKVEKCLLMQARVALKIGVRVVSE